MTMAKAREPRTRLEIELAGDRGMAEEVILEMRALAARAGLRMPEATIVSRGAKRKKARTAKRST